MPNMIRPFSYLLPAMPVGNNVVILPAINRGLFLRADICDDGVDSYNWGVSMSPSAAKRLAGATPTISVVNPSSGLVGATLPGILPQYSSIDNTSFDAVFNLFSPRTVSSGGADTSYVSGGNGIPFDAIGLDANTPPGQGSNLFLFLSCVVSHNFFLKLYLVQ